MTNLTPSQIQRLVAETLGWKRWGDDTECGSCGWLSPDGTYSEGIGCKGLPNFHESLDACYEAFEKDAPEGYWYQLYIITGAPRFTFDHLKAAIAVARATPLQRCEAFLRWKGVIQ